MNSDHIKNWPASERPREKLFARGAHALSDAELLAIFVQSGGNGLNAIEMSRNLLLKFGDLRKLLRADKSQLCETKGIGEARYALLKGALELGQRYLQISPGDRVKLGNPSKTREFAASRLVGYEQEVFMCMFMDVRNRLITCEELFFGTIDCAAVYPREVARRCLAHNAAAVIFAHNHPSGDATPSETDRRITRRLIKALGLLDIRVLDHLVVGEGQVTSFTELGLL